MKEIKKTLTIDITEFTRKVMFELGYIPGRGEPITDEEMDKYIRASLRSHIDNILDNYTVQKQIAVNVDKYFTTSPRTALDSISGQRR